MTQEEVSLFSNGLASPVTLAPKSARPTNELSPELMAAFASASASNDATSRPIDIDLTVPDTSNPSVASNGSDVEMSLDPALGNSADKPIELDLEGMDIDMSNMTDLFGDSADTSSSDANAAVEGLFSPSTTAADGKVIKGEGEIGMGLLDALSVSGEDGDLFASFGEKSRGNDQTNENKEDPTGSSSSVVTAPLPASLLDGFTSVSNIHAQDHPTQPGESSFHLLDLAHLSHGFFPSSQESGMNLMDFLNLGEVDSGLVDGEKPSS
jgi:hypothetical protein